MSVDTIVGIAQNGMSQQMKRSELAARRISLAGVPVPASFSSASTSQLSRGGVSDLIDENGQQGLKFSKVYDPGNPSADASGYVQYLDVDVAEEFIEMNLAKRSYEAHIRLFNNASEMAAKALEIGK